MGNLLFNKMLVKFMKRERIAPAKIQNGKNTEKNSSKKQSKKATMQVKSPLMLKNLKWVETLHWDQKILIIWARACTIRLEKRSLIRGWTSLQLQVMPCQQIRWTSYFSESQTWRMN